MKKLNRSDVLRKVRFTNKYYHHADGKLHSFTTEDDNYSRNDLEVLHYRKLNCVKVSSENDYDYFAELDDYLKNGCCCEFVFRAAVADLCALSDTSYGYLKG